MNKNEETDSETRQTNSKAKKVRWWYVIGAFFAMVVFLIILWWPRHGEFWSWPWLRFAGIFYYRIGPGFSIFFSLCIIGLFLRFIWETVSPTIRAIIVMVVVVLFVLLMFSMLVCSALDWH